MCYYPSPITHRNTCDRAKMASYHLTTHPSAGGPKDIRNQPVRLLTLTEWCQHFIWFVVFCSHSWAGGPNDIRKQLVRLLTSTEWCQHFIWFVVFCLWVWDGLPNNFPIKKGMHGSSLYKQTNPSLMLLSCLKCLSSTFIL